MERFRGGLVFKAHRLLVSLNSGLESDKLEEELRGYLVAAPLLLGSRFRVTELPCGPPAPPPLHLQTAASLIRSTFELQG
jgi:hypothetical protein